MRRFPVAQRAGCRRRAYGLLCALFMAATVSAQASVDVRGREGTPWGANYFPNVKLLTHEGQEVRFFDDLVDGKIVVINFIYTTCTEVCPLDTASLRNVQEILGDRVGKDVFMYSISIDPERDSPEVLAEYARRYRVGPGWKFLTGAKEDTLLLRKKLGLYIEGLENELDHNMSFVIGNQRTGRWLKRSPMDNPHFIAQQISGWADNWKTPSGILANEYAHAPLLEPPSMGENLFRTRCISCHSIGSGDPTRAVGHHSDTPTAQHQSGPDLLHVTRKRDHQWLARWLASPETLIAERDPIALEIYAKYDGLLMPNLQLNDVEVNALIEYMSTESLRVQKALDATPEEKHEPSGHQHHHHDH